MKKRLSWLEQFERADTAKAHADGKKSARHAAWNKKKAEVLTIIRNKGCEAGIKAAQSAGLLAHPEIRKALAA